MQEHEHADDPLIGQVIGGRFEVRGVLGEGGMGCVYEAIQQPIRRRVAVKVLRDDHLDDAVVRARFLREARSLGGLTHPHLVTIFDYGELDGGQVYIAMELLQGQTLSDWLRAHPDPTLSELLHVTRGICSGLSEAHVNGIVHRDLKPSNVLLVPSHERDALPTPKVLDFGIARDESAENQLTRTGMIFGTPAYMSPEQASGERGIGPATDVYAIGVMLYEMLAGERPFDSAKPLQLLFAHATKPPPPLVARPGLRVSDALRALVFACLEKAPADRPPDARAVLERLDEIVAAELAPMVSGASPVLDLVTHPALAADARLDTGAELEDRAARRLDSADSADVARVAQDEDEDLVPDGATIPMSALPVDAAFAHLRGADRARAPGAVPAAEAPAAAASGAAAGRSRGASGSARWIAIGAFVLIAALGLLIYALGRQDRPPAEDTPPVEDPPEVAVERVGVLPAGEPGPGSEALARTPPASLGDALNIELDAINAELTALERRARSVTTSDVASLWRRAERVERSLERVPSAFARENLEFRLRALEPRLKRLEKRHDEDDDDDD